MSRWVRVQAEIFEHPIFDGDELSTREAWLWLVAKAAWKPTKHRVGMTMVDVPRGSLMVTVRQLQDAWGWGSGRVQRVLNLFENQHMIARESGTGKTLISICNYDKYQDRGTEAAQERHTDGTQAAQKRHTKDTSIPDTKEKGYLSETASPRPTRKRKSYPEDFLEFWSAYPTDGLMSKLEASKAHAKLSDDDKAAALAAIPAFKAHCRANPDYRPVHACRFLSQRRFDGFAPAQPMARGDPMDNPEIRAARIFQLQQRIEHGTASQADRDEYAGLAGTDDPVGENVLRFGSA